MINNEKNNSTRKTAVNVGLLFIAATLGTILGFAVLDPILNAPDILISFPENSRQVIAGVLFLFINSAAVAAIPVLLSPILGKHNKTLAVGYLASRIIESVILTGGLISLLAVLTLGQIYSLTPDSVPAIFQISGKVLLAIYDWSFLIGIMIVFGMTALILNFLLFQSKLIPRWISLLGIIGAILLLIAGLLEMFGVHPIEILSMPIAVQEMIFAGWLIIKGFNQKSQGVRSADARPD